MASAVSCTQNLLTSLRNGDASSVANALAVFVQRSVVADDPSDWHTAVETILASLQSFSRHAFLTALAVAALDHTTRQQQERREQLLLIVIAAGKRHHTDAMVCQCVARFLYKHCISPRAMHMLPEVTDAASKMIAAFQQDEDIAYWCGVVLVRAASFDSDDVKRAHGKAGANAIDVSIVVGATATTLRVEGLLVEGEEPWNTWVLSRMFPRLREA